MLTADTITDEQIHALWREACGTCIADVNPDVMHMCTVATNLKGDFTRGEQSRARESCAEILNSRALGSPHA